MQEYQETLREFYKGMMKRSAATIETLQKGATPIVHVESGEARASGVLTEEELSENDKLIKTFKIWGRYRSWSSVKTRN